MGMFKNYQNTDNYIPDNTTQHFPVGKSYTKLSPVLKSRPYEEYDFSGKLIGYSWNYGETIVLDFDIDGEITVACNSIILTTTGEYPTDTTPGSVDQKAYNIVDMRSWTCIVAFDDHWIWQEDAEFLYDENGSQTVYISAEEFLHDKLVRFTIYNFRRESIYSKEFQGTPNIIIELNEEDSRKLVRGVYCCKLEVYNEDTNIVVFSEQDCSLLVK